MSRLSFRPRPLDIHKKLPIVKSIKDFEDFEETPTSASTRNSQVLRLAAAEADNEVHQIPSKKSASEIPTPQFDFVDTYERDYSSTFTQPTSYLRGRGARAEIGEFVEYDLDNEDEDWLEEFNNERKIITNDKFESLLFKLEVLDHKARERAGVITPTLGSPIPVLLQLDAAMEALQAQSIRYSVFQSIYNYWKNKRERWQKPILRRLQPPPPVNDTNPYNVFRPREKAHRLHTRRMQRRENNVQSFEKLRQVRRNLDQAKTILEALIKREEKKRDVMENEVNLQRIQMKYKHETELLEDSLALTGFTTFPCKFGSSEEEFVDSDDVNSRPRTRPAAAPNISHPYSQLMMASTGSMKREFRRQHVLHGWLHKMDPTEPVLLFARPLDPEKLAAAGIVPPLNSSIKNVTSPPPFKFHGRIGRGGRIVFDRWNPLMHTPIDTVQLSESPKRGE
ncbi:enhancer of polycomb-like protein 1 isoform X2 [Malania oleifera]|uniref:enhancer of polycomb-like protein 1 isoform X2 n=1 Tax=Malania oleifera TaxID=397392 RepID=UPI0025ADAF0D|nr:enhancer of polycomb-like protein 1 isoform X2 [Malania oleifera]XP_057977163.1 enhancer of polycomb-like protein 1 isoform X2 [Malania oleifera]